MYFFHVAGAEFVLCRDKVVSSAVTMTLDEATGSLLIRHKEGSDRVLAAAIVCMVQQFSGYVWPRPCAYGFCFHSRAGVVIFHFEFPPGSCLFNSN